MTNKTVMVVWGATALAIAAYRPVGIRREDAYQQTQLQQTSQLTSAKVERAQNQQNISKALSSGESLTAQTTKVQQASTSQQYTPPPPTSYNVQAQRTEENVYYESNEQNFLSGLADIAAGGRLSRTGGSGAPSSGNPIPR